MRRPVGSGNQRALTPRRAACLTREANTEPEPDRNGALTTRCSGAHTLPALGPRCQRRARPRAGVGVGDVQASAIGPVLTPLTPERASPDRAIVWPAARADFVTTYRHDHIAPTGRTASRTALTA